MNKTSIVVLTYNQLSYTKLCLESVRRYTNVPYELIVVDNGSTDGTVEWLKTRDDILLKLNDKNAGFAGGCNMGIAMANPGNDILLLNNDTYVTENYLFNLQTALHSAADVGAVAPLGALPDERPFEYQEISKLHEQAKRYNVSNPLKWERVLKLIGFCLLIKRSALEKTGCLDERFWPGNAEDDDYCIRLVLNNYKLFLCRDTYIHHYVHVSFVGQVSESEGQNLGRFFDKWGFLPSYSFFARGRIAELISRHPKAALNILDIGCSCGESLLKITDKYPNAKLYGAELNENAAKIAALFASVTVCDIELVYPYPDNFFDCIMLGDVCQQLRDPWALLSKIRKSLKPGGIVLASIPNVAHISVLADLINGYWVQDIMNLRFFTGHSIAVMFGKAGFVDIEMSRLLRPLADREQELLDKICTIAEEDLRGNFIAAQYIIKAKKSFEK